MCRSGVAPAPAQTRRQWTRSARRPAKRDMRAAARTIVRTERGALSREKDSRRRRPLGNARSQTGPRRPRLSRRRLRSNRARALARRIGGSGERGRRGSPTLCRWRWIRSRAATCAAERAARCSACSSFSLARSASMTAARFVAPSPLSLVAMCDGSGTASHPAPSYVALTIQRRHVCRRAITNNRGDAGLKRGRIVTHTFRRRRAPRPRRPTRCPRRAPWRCGHGCLSPLFHRS